MIVTPHRFRAWKMTQNPGSLLQVSCWIPAKVKLDHRSVGCMAFTSKLALGWISESQRRAALTTACRGVGLARASNRRRSCLVMRRLLPDEASSQTTWLNLHITALIPVSCQIPRSQVWSKSGTKITCQEHHKTCKSLATSGLPRHHSENGRNCSTYRSILTSWYLELKASRSPTIHTTLQQPSTQFLRHVFNEPLPLPPPSIECGLRCCHCRARYNCGLDLGRCGCRWCLKCRPWPES